MGVSLRRLSGWEPAEVTTFEYDGDRLVRQLTVREPEFDRVGVALLLASRRHEASIGAHGIPMSEALDEANRGSFVPYMRTDWARKAVEDARELSAKEYPHANRNGQLWAVRRPDEHP